MKQTKQDNRHLGWSCSANIELMFVFYFFMFLVCLFTYTVALNEVRMVLHSFVCFENFIETKFDRKLVFFCFCCRRCWTKEILIYNLDLRCQPSYKSWLGFWPILGWWQIPQFFKLRNSSFLIFMYTGLVTTKNTI
jgi:hypothetical protein